jgi:ribose 1,5-bisphosphokinase PhnN
MKSILALIGESGVGKSSLLAELITRQPALFAALPSHTSRPRRENDPHDEIVHRFVSRDEMATRIEADEVIAPLDYAGNLYGVLYETAHSVLSEQIGVIALVEHVLLEYRALGFKVYAVRVKGIGHKSRSKQRKRLDQARAEITFDPDLIIVNDHTSPDGFTEAYRAFEEFALTLV